MQDLRDYKQIELSLVTDLEKLRELAQKHGHPSAETELCGALQRLHSGRFTLAVVGEFQRGKSTLVNALLGEHIFPTDVLPNAATLNRLVYSPEKFVDFNYHDGRQERIPLERLTEYVTPVRAAQIRETVVSYPCRFCRNHVELVDTPGLQGEVLPHLDAAILVLSAFSPLSDSEQAFLEQLADGHCARLFLVVNSIDRLEDPTQLEHLMAGLQGRLERMNENVRRSLHPKLFPVSAYRALQARLTNDGELLRSSRMEELESVLATFLGDERAVALLLVPLNITGTAINGLRQHLQQKVNDWQRRNVELQEAKLQVDSPAQTPAATFAIEPMRQLLSQDPSWKSPLRQRMETLAQELPSLLGPAEGKGGIFASLKSSLDIKGRESLARDIFQRLVQALEEGLNQYERDVLFALDRLWDDFLDQFPSPGPPLEGLRRNQEWTQGLIQTLRQRLQLSYAGGFNSWASRPQKLTVLEIRRELEGELIRQLGADISGVYREWLERIEVAYKPLPTSTEDRTDALRQWVRQSVLQEKEQADLRSDWILLHAVEERLKLLRQRLIRLGPARS